MTNWKKHLKPRTQTKRAYFWEIKNSQAWYQKDSRSGGPSPFPPIPHPPHDLTSTYEWKHFWKTSGVQLRSCRNPAEHQKLRMSKQKSIGSNSPVSFHPLGSHSLLPKEMPSQLSPNGRKGEQEDTSSLRHQRPQQPLSLPWTWTNFTSKDPYSLCYVHTYLSWWSSLEPGPLCSFLEPEAPLLPNQVRAAWPSTTAGTTTYPTQLAFSHPPVGQDLYSPELVQKHCSFNAHIPTKDYRNTKIKEPWNHQRNFANF